MSEFVEKTSVYVTIFIVLVVLTVITTAVSFYDFGVLNNVVALSIAGFKAFLVIMFFMHVRHGKPVTRLVIGASLLWLTIMLVLLFSDYATRAWLLTAPYRTWIIGDPSHS